jgi:pyruvate kinase
MEKTKTIEALRRELAEIRDEMLDLESEVLADPIEIHRDFLESARNLVHYLALRRHDLRDLQISLAELGLSSLGHAEAHVLQNVDAVIELLRAAAGDSPSPRRKRAPLTLHQGKALLDMHTHELLGGLPAQRSVRIMVTLPTEASEDRRLVSALVEAGMDCARINCAHDDPDAWARMIENLRAVERETGGARPVAMDLAGPKLRTGAVEMGPEVVKIKPTRDELGRVVSTARIRLIADGAKVTNRSHVSIPVPEAWLRGLETGDSITFEDTSGSERKFVVIERDADSVWVEIAQTAYVTTGAALHHRLGTATVGRLAAREHPIGLSRGDTLVLSSDGASGARAERDPDGHVVLPARISCTLTEVFDRVRVGERIFLDDGKIGGVIRRVGSGEIHVEVTAARERGENLRGDKGINLPDTDLALPALTAKDLEDLDFVAAHADIVNYSFVHDPADLDALDAQLAARGAAHLGVILKIETRRAFENLPNLLLTAMRSPRRGVMIARGDLAVECGFERMAEVQEEILWLCEAAHLPVVWATQVLETLAKAGAPSRAEITDAAMSNRAECVMLNKGPHIVRAVSVLDDILCRMADHQSKKTPTLRRLGVARGSGC